MNRLTEDNNLVYNEEQSCQTQCYEVCYSLNIGSILLVYPSLSRDNLALKTACVQNQIPEYLHYQSGLHYWQS